MKFKNSIPPWDRRYVSFTPKSPDVDFSITFPDINVVRKRINDKVFHYKTNKVNHKKTKLDILDPFSKLAKPLLKLPHNPEIDIHKDCPLQTFEINQIPKRQTPKTKRVLPEEYKANCE